jgi:ATP-dependent protease HslVU (ClpYQ) peptidase subunit
VTTIATDGKTMAGDGQAEACHTIICTTRAKVARLSDGSLFGSAGRGADNLAMIEWLESGMEDKRPRLKSFSGLRLFADGRLEYWSEDVDVPTPVDVPCAVGSGMDFAIGAMLCGASPEQAVAIASQRDPGTGGKIIVLRL